VRRERERRKRCRTRFFRRRTRPLESARIWPRAAASDAGASLTP
jgi:hypothetical protein